MSVLTLETNILYKFLKNNLQENLLRWAEHFLICIPENSILHDIESDVCSGAFAASQVLILQNEEKQQYHSELLGTSIIYEITGGVSRAIIWQEDDLNEVVVSKASILDEHLISYEDSVLHILLIDRCLPSMIQDDRFFLDQLSSYSVTTNKEAHHFLRRFKCHWPVLEWLEEELQRVQREVLPSDDVDQIQYCLHGLILQSWDYLVKRHLVQVQMDTHFQDLLFRSLDFFVVGVCHNELWNQVMNRCHLADKMVKARMSFLRSSDISPSQLGMKGDLCVPLPAALVEMASINGRSSAIEMLHCVKDSIEFIEAQTKETKALLCQFNDSDSSINERTSLTEDEIISLMMVIVVQAQCFTLVANIYYMTHYVFSVTDELHPLWKSLSILRRSLERIMKLDITNLPPATHPLRRELSLQDLMQVSVEVESVFEGRRKEGSLSTSDITALNLQLRSLTSRIQQSTQAQSETFIEEKDSPSRRSDSFCPSSGSSYGAGAAAVAQSPRKVQSIVDFVSIIPSSIRASFRRKQDEKRSALPVDYTGE